MPRREILTPTERMQLLAFPDDEGELIRKYTLSKADLAFVRQHRGDHNRLGIAVQMCSLRYPGRVLGENARPPDRLLNLVATQLGISIVAWDVYAQRDETRREHLLELLPRLGMEQFGIKHYRAISAWLESTALQTTQGIVLVQTAVDELRRRLVVLPSLMVLERLCAEVATRAQRKIFAILTAGLTATQRRGLDQLLELREGSPYSTWLRLPPGAPTAKAVLTHIERLKEIRNLDLSAEIGRKVHQNRLLQLAREGGQTAVYQLKEYEADRRHATLVALMIETAATLTDEAFDLHDRLIGSFFTKSKDKYERTFAEQGKAINDKVRLYAKVGSALVAAREQGRDPYAAIEAVISWENFSASVREAEQLARDEDFNPLSLLTEHFSQLRRYSPTLLEAFEFHPASVARELIQAVNLLRQMNRDGSCKVPSNAPTGFIRKCPFMETTYTIEFMRLVEPPLAPIKQPSAFHVAYYSNPSVPLKNRSRDALPADLCPGAGLFAAVAGLVGKEWEWLSELLERVASVAKGFILTLDLGVCPLEPSCCRMGEARSAPITTPRRGCGQASPSLQPQAQ